MSSVTHTTSRGYPTIDPKSGRLHWLYYKGKGYSVKFRWESGDNKTTQLSANISAESLPTHQEGRYWLIAAKSGPTTLGDATIEIWEDPGINIGGSWITIKRKTITIPASTTDLNYVIDQIQDLGLNSNAFTLIAKFAANASVAAEIVLKIIAM